MAAWQWFVAAAFAPVVVWLLWRVQAWSVDHLLRASLLRLLRSFRWIYNPVSWFGTFLHEVSHATVLLLGGHGIKGFKAGVEGGQVSPRRTRRGPIGFLSFLAAAMAPIYLPPLAILLLTWGLVDRGVLAWRSAGTGLEPAWHLLRDLVLEFPVQLSRALVGLDVASWQGALIFLLVLLAMPSSRPSFVKGSKFHEGDEGDVAVIRRRLRRNPVPFVVFLALLYGLYFGLVPWFPQAYWSAFAFVWSVALTGILLAAFGAVVWVSVAWAGRIAVWLAWLPLAAAMAVQVLARLPAAQGVPGLDDLRVVNAASLALLAGLSLALRFVAPRRGLAGL